MKTNSKKLALAGVLCAVAVVGSMLQFPVFASRIVAMSFCEPRSCS